MDLSSTELITLTGPPLVLALLNWGLCGVLSVQVYLYSQAFPKDRATLKAMVYGVYLLEIAQTILLTGTVWDKLAKGFGNLDALNEVGTTWLSVCLIGGATAMVAQIFYAYRIRVISENKIIPIFILLMSLTSFVSAAVLSKFARQAAMVKVRNSDANARMTATYIGIWTGAGSACDIAIATCMCFYLSKRIRNGCFPQTQALITRIKLMTIETGALTATVSVVSITVYYAPGLTGVIYYSVPISVLAKLYSNTMLAVLNSRMKLSLATEATTWQNNELPQIPLSTVPQQSNAIMEIRFASANSTTHSDHERAGGEKQQASGVAEREAEVYV